ncbi:aminoglycoside phosphotransferase family protein [Nonomuraea sp. PA05]|uniref:aminoglycoside phosphotransferase family protein n=1 Tax=Nonomuraea sp. PA05 TaxID=2604466 RepID=UPI0011DA7D20|nr:aminoglycoside phosphotransferase family protein [Nonomuraea sp. PA05]TYB51612.1 aminoglycoside phosphotransferase family protein [Nonomuraea sp. PA05]
MISRSAAVSAAVAVAEEHGVRVVEPVVLNDSFNLRILLRPAPVVARVPTTTALGRPDPAGALGREVAVVSYLRDAGAPVVPPSDLLPAGPHLRDGVAMSFWAHVPHDPGHVVTPDVAGGMLAELHAVLRGFPGELPFLEPVLDEPVRLLDLLSERGSGLVGAGELARLREAHAALAAQVRDEAAGVQAVHGDAHPGNLLATPAGLLWNDFKECMAAPVEWDLACLLRTTRLDGRAAVRAYGTDPGAPGLRAFLAARGLQGTLWVLARALRFPGQAGAARSTLRTWLSDPSGAIR